jgi:hypothetical protein
MRCKRAGCNLTPNTIPELLLTRACLDAVQAGLAPEIQSGHEGIVYLLGRTYGIVTLAPAAESADGKWADLAAADIVVSPGAGPWTASSGSTSATAGRSGTAIVV